VLFAFRDASSQHTLAAPRAADHFVLEVVGRQAVRGSEVLRSLIRLCPCWVFALRCLAACAFVRWVSVGARAFLGRVSVAAASALCVLGLPCTLPQHTSAAPHAADRFFVKRSGGQAVRGSEARRSATLVSFFFCVSYWSCCVRSVAPAGLLS
jgi:hypothetical protein